MLEESEQEYDKALALDPGNPGFRSAGFTYASLGKYEKALKAFDLDEGSSLTLFNYGKIMLSKNRIEEAITYYDALLEQEPNGVFYYFAWSMKFIINENYQDAFIALQKFENENPLDGEFWFTMAQIYGLMGDERSCARTLERAIDKGYFNYPLIQNDSDFDHVRNGQKFFRVMLKAREKHEDFKQKYYQNRTKSINLN
jgi:tetratricopeptide (TPR) repeat protein